MKSHTTVQGDTLRLSKVELSSDNTWVKELRILVVSSLTGIEGSDPKE